MKAVGIRELRDQFSRYVAEVRQGEVVLVTDRGEVVAELRPPGARVAADVPVGLQRLAERGELRLGLPNDPAAYPDLGIRAPAGTVRSLLDEAREDR